MKISIPIPVVPLSWNGIDYIETLFDNETSDPRFYATDLKFRDSEDVYINTGSGYQVLPYDPLATYSVDDIVFKEEEIGGVGTGIDKIHKVQPNIQPKQPAEYSPQPAGGYDETLWNGRYAKLQDIPSGVTETAVTFGLTSSARDTCFAGNGTHFYKNYGDRIYHYILSSAYDLATAGGIADSNWYIGTANTRAVFVSPTGNKVWFIRTDLSYQITEWNISNFSVASMTFVTSRSMGYSFQSAFTFSADGTRVFIGYSNGNVRRIPLNGTWTIVNSTFSDQLLNDYIIVPNNITSIEFNLDGTRLYVQGEMGDMGVVIVEYNFSTAYDLSSVTGIVSIKRTPSTERMILKRNGTGFYNKEGSNLVLYRNTSSWNITYSMASTNNFDVSEIRGSNIYHYQLINKTNWYYKVFYFSNFLYLTAGPLSTVNSYTALTTESIDQPATIISGTTPDYQVFVPKTAVIDSQSIYIRTHLNIIGETVTLEGYAFVVVDSPKDLTDFVYFEPTNPYKPFDDKNYTIATVSDSVTYTLQGADSFDTIALGNTKAEHITIWFNGEEIPTIDVDINTDRDTHGHLPPWHTTLIYYTANNLVLPKDATVTVTLTGPEIQIGTIMLGISAEAGFTNLSLKNDYKDFSVFEQDQWGNIDYTERAKVARYSGTVDMRIENYDMTDRLMMSLGKNLVIVNGSDLGSDQSDSTSIFAATQKIGRFTSFSQRTVVKDDDLDVMATYSFTLEEIV